LTSGLMYEVEFDKPVYNPGDSGNITFKASTDIDIPMTYFEIKIFGHDTDFLMPIINLTQPDSLFEIDEPGPLYVSFPSTGVSAGFVLDDTIVEAGDYSGPVFPFEYFGADPIEYDEILYAASATYSPGTLPFISKSADAVPTVSI